MSLLALHKTTEDTNVFPDERLRAKTPKLRAAITRLTQAIASLSAETDFQTNEIKQREVNVLRDKLLTLEKKRHGIVQTSTTVRYILNAESPSKYWSAVNREKKPRDLFYSMKEPSSEPPIYRTRSDKMAELARDYHYALQSKDIEEGEEPRIARDEAINRSLGSLTNRLPLEGADELLMNKTEQEILDALKKAGPGKAAGLDGLPYELWIKLHEKWTQSTQKSPHRLNCLDLLRLLYTDIDQHGICAGTGFTDGWMCPIYKGKDRREIPNYRPITLLNADYKVYTRILATRMGRWISTVIHPDQAGFIPGRSIADQTQLCKTMVDYAEAIEDNGVIIALDQEKAYDRIRHDYLWRVLEILGLPPRLIARIKALYEAATTIVMINGEPSSPFRITRGVRQGDPLSCLLFDMAIEPLASALRHSRLKGFQIPGTAERLIATLFADDTSTFLSEEDTWGGLWTILNDWCLASGARFNGGKTEVIPVGTKEYRDRVTTTRMINQDVPNDTIPQSVRIAGDGEPVRILGAWIGNNLDEVAVWAPTLQKVEQFLARWGRCRPSLLGKKHIIQMGPGGMTQYLTTVQGMPKETETALTDAIRAFIWNGGKPTVAMDTLTKPLEEGGMGILDIVSRNEAIDLMWIKKYLTLTENRPRWAFVVDVLLSKFVSKDAGAIKKNAQINSFLQTWKPAVHGKSGLPNYLKRILKTAQKYNVSFAAIKMDKRMKTALPIWYHLGATKHLRRLNNTKTSNCLRDNHGITYVVDLLNLTRRNCHTEATRMSNDFIPRCECETCEQDSLKGCKHPLKCCRAASTLLAQIRQKWNPFSDTTPDGLSLTKRRKEANTDAIRSKGDTLFDPSLTERGPVEEAFRVFVDPAVHDRPPAIRARRGRLVPEEGVTAYITGRLKKKTIPREAQSRQQNSGFVTYTGTEETHQWVKPAPGLPKGVGRRGELLAALKATMDTPRDAPLRIICPSQRMITDLTIRLPHWEDKGWLGIADAQVLRTLVNNLRQRNTPTTLSLATSRKEQEQAYQASERSREALRDGRPTLVNLEINLSFDLSGAKMATLTQAVAYRGIRAARKLADRPRTQRNIKRVMDHLQEKKIYDQTETTLWRSLRGREVHRKIADFLWKSIHETHRIGHFWSKIPGYEDRELCPTCEVTESMEHILTKCKAKGQKEVWRLTRALWLKKKQTWESPTFEGILAAGMGNYPRTTESKRKESVARLWRIIIPEAAYLIWKLRCERVIGHEDEDGWQHSKKEIIRRWYATMNRRLHTDLIATNKRFGSLTKNSSLIWSTWTGTIGDEMGLYEDWTKVPWVLVGIDPGICSEIADPG